MSRSRRAKQDTGIEKAVLLIMLFGYGGLVRFWDSLTSTERWIFGVLAGSAFVVFVAFVLVFSRYRKKKREAAWNRAMSSLSHNGQGRFNISGFSIEGLSPQGLEELAMRVYRKMGYRSSLTGGTGDHGVDVYLIDPRGRVELVQCKQWHRPVGEPEIRDLMGAIVHEKAAKGYFWAPGGFSWSARQWAKGKPIFLMDKVAIGRVIESVYTE